MGILLLICFSASVFSIEDSGQEKNLFKNPFLGKLDYGRIEFAVKPEFTLMNSNSNFRGLYWTNPFCLNMKIPVHKGLIFSFGNLERFDQSFDIYSKREMLAIYAQGRGGVEEIYLQLNQSSNLAEVFFRGSYLYGSSREIWEYTMGDYSIADTFYYKNKGRVFCVGLKILIVSFYYEGLGRLLTEKPSSDTTYDLPQILGLGVDYHLKDWKLGLLFEHSFIEGGGINRFKGLAERGNFGFTYAYNPWYSSGIQEHVFGISVRTYLKNYAKISFVPDIGIRTKGSLREFVFSPVLQLTLEEIFARRKK